MECCRVENMLREYTIIGLPAGWVDTDVRWLCISISPPQTGGTCAPLRPSPVTWWSKLCTNSSVVIRPRIWICHMAKETEPFCSNHKQNWMWTGILPDRSDKSILGIKLCSEMELFFMVTWRSWSLGLRWNFVSVVIFNVTAWRLFCVIVLYKSIFTILLWLWKFALCEVVEMEIRISACSDILLWHQWLLWLLQPADIRRPVVWTGT